MYRWLGAAIAVVAIALAACGRQLTGLDAPDAGSIQPGHMLIRYRVAGPLNFDTVEYLIVFNTKGNGAEPYPAIQLSGASNYSFAFAVGGNASTSAPLLFQYYLEPSGILGTIGLTIPPQLMNYIPNSGGNPSGGGEFTIDFARSLLTGANLSGSPTPVAAPSPTPTGVSPMPAATPTGGSPAATATPGAIWYINFITIDPSTHVPIDSMGSFGATDTTFKLPIDTTQFVDDPFTKPTGLPSINNASAQLQGYEVINAP